MDINNSLLNRWFSKLPRGMNLYTKCRWSSSTVYAVTDQFHKIGMIKAAPSIVLSGTQVWHFKILKYMSPGANLEFH